MLPTKKISSLTPRRRKSRTPPSRSKSIGSKPRVESDLRPKKNTKSPEISDTESNEGNSLNQSFKEYLTFNKRMANTLYFANNLPLHPRPSLPLTTVAVETFSKHTRKDTLEFIDIDFAAEITRNACVSSTTLIMALIYLERLSKNNPTYLEQAKPSELFIVSLLLAEKFAQVCDEDLNIYNDEWARSTNLPLSRIHELEINFLIAIDWNLNISSAIFESTLGTLEGILSTKEGLNRGWFTYTEIAAIFRKLDLGNVFWPLFQDYIIKVLSLSIMAYSAVVASLFASAVLASNVSSMIQTCDRSLNTAGHNETSSIKSHFQLQDSLREIKDFETNTIDGTSTLSAEIISQIESKLSESSSSLKLNYNCKEQSMDVGCEIQICHRLLRDDEVFDWKSLDRINMGYCWKHNLAHRVNQLELRGLMANSIQRGELINSNIGLTLSY